MTAVAIIEVHKGEDGVWEAHERPAHAAEDVDTVEGLDRYRSVTAEVRVAGEVRSMTVYLEDEDDGFVVFEDLYASR